ncbi:predicted protein [Streptomyces viridosporus ATCC 14672]|uniref:Predicted protein n=1 Tax=Streptomyces viridosporus (strain ATCC 14672 / DSM 40746 / JCM 4963 / KCTC 9882 / NRRL B-12104 / FH 1290) TaxID=566461 RepID=D5ZXY3_STRV1|nr:predicted protein [Streptomyces viridosporus ATCC 14672]
MVSSHTPWQDMQAWMQSCISLLIGVAAADCWVMVPPGGREGRGFDPRSSVLRLSLHDHHRRPRPTRPVWDTTHPAPA